MGVPKLGPCADTGAMTGAVGDFLVRAAAGPRPLNLSTGLSALLECAVPHPLAASSPAAR